MKKIAYVLIVIGLLLMINSLLHSIYNLWQKQDLVTSAQIELDKEKQKNQKLTAEFSYSQTPQFLQQQAYDKLLLVKPGEQKVLVSQTIGLEKAAKLDKRPNWQKWLDLIL